MSKENKEKKNNTPVADTDKEETPVTPLVINSQYLKDFSFESPNAPGIFLEMKHAPEIKVNLDVKAAKINEEHNIFQISLFVNAEAKYEDKTVFICETEYAAIATINVKPEQLEPVLLVEIPRYLFPFSRNVIADATREGGFAPLMLQPVDFLSLYVARKQQEAAQKDEKKN